MRTQEVRYVSFTPRNLVSCQRWYNKRRQRGPGSCHGPHLVSELLIKHLITCTRLPDLLHFIRVGWTNSLVVLNFRGTHWLFRDSCRSEPNKEDKGGCRDSFRLGMTEGHWPFGCLNLCRTSCVVRLDTPLGVGFRTHEWHPLVSDHVLPDPFLRSTSVEGKKERPLSDGLWYLWTPSPPHPKGNTQYRDRRLDLNGRSSPRRPTPSPNNTYTHHPSPEVL